MKLPSHWLSPTNSEEQYPIHIGKGLLAKAVLFRPHVKSKQIFILSHPVIAKHYLAQLKQTLQRAGAHKIDYCAIPAGEQYKSLSSAERIWTALMKHQHHRDSVIIALGGGVIGDLGGFCAGCYHRGIAYIQCPTSLIAQIDAAVGGKTAVNAAGVKNPIGLFHQPKAVIVDVNTLGSLPQREYIAGFAELIKYGLGFDSAFFGWLEKNIHLLLSKDSKVMHTAIAQACALKAAVVAKDTQDHHERLKLNLGHTVGHALEALKGKSLRHGEAVAIGMVVATKISVFRRNIPHSVLDRLVGLLSAVGLPTECPPGISVKAILHKIAFDKKNQYGQKRFVLLAALGSAYTATDVAETLLIKALKPIEVVEI